MEFPIKISACLLLKGVHDNVLKIVLICIRLPVSIFDLSCDIHQLPDGALGHLWISFGMRRGPAEIAFASGSLQTSKKLSVMCSDQNLFFVETNIEISAEGNGRRQSSKNGGPGRPRKPSYLEILNLDSAFTQI